MYFNTLSTVEQIKNEYRSLAKQYHPDLNIEDTTAAMQDINAQYQEAVARCDGQVSQDEDGREHTYTYNQATEQAIIDKIADILSMQLEGIEVWLVGTWIWVDGDTKPYKEILKDKDGLNMKWQRKRQKWYWHNGPKRRRRSSASFGMLAARYGATHFKNETEKAIA